ncbi:hypothetical protein B0H14DRAFT_3643501, partial [Mycena olivaceomarginata]
TPAPRTPLPFITIRRAHSSSRESAGSSGAALEMPALVATLLRRREGKQSGAEADVRAAGVEAPCVEVVFTRQLGIGDIVASLRCQARVVEPSLGPELASHLHLAACEPDRSARSWCEADDTGERVLCFDCLLDPPILIPLIGPASSRLHISPRAHRTSGSHSTTATANPPRNTTLGCSRHLTLYLQHRLGINHHPSLYHELHTCAHTRTRFDEARRCRDCPCLLLANRTDLTNRTDPTSLSRGLYTPTPLDSYTYIISYISSEPPARTHGHGLRTSRQCPSTVHDLYCIVLAVSSPYIVAPQLSAFEWILLSALWYRSLTTVVRKVEEGGRGEHL